MFSDTCGATALLVAPSALLTYLLGPAGSKRDTRLGGGTAILLCEQTGVPLPQQAILLLPPTAARVQTYGGHNWDILGLSWGQPGFTSLPGCADPVESNFPANPPSPHSARETGFLRKYKREGLCAGARRDPLATLQIPPSLWATPLLRLGSWQGHVTPQATEVHL